MTDIPKLKIHLVENPRKAFRFTFTKTAIPAPAAPVDEASIKIVEAHQQRALAEARIRALAEAQERTLAEAQERTLAEAQKLTEAEPQTLPLTDEEESQRWNAYYIAQNALKREKQLAEYEHEKQQQVIEDARKRALTAFEYYRIFGRTPIAPVAPVAHPTPVAEVAQGKPTRTRTFNKCV